MGESVHLKPIETSRAVSQYRDFFGNEEENVGKTITWKLHVRKMAPKTKNIMGVVAQAGAVMLTTSHNNNFPDSTMYLALDGSDASAGGPQVLSELVPGSGHYVFLHSNLIATLLERKLEEGDTIVVRGWIARRADYQPDVKDEKVKFPALVLQPEEAVFLGSAPKLTPVPIATAAPSPLGDLPEPPPMERK